MGTIAQYNARVAIGDIRHIHCPNGNWKDESEARNPLVVGPDTVNVIVDIVNNVTYGFNVIPLWMMTVMYIRILKNIYIIFLVQ